MSTRRDFMSRAATVGIAATSGVLLAGAAEPLVQASPRIRSVVRREDTLLRLGGEGDNWHMSWAADDRQILALCDGLGFSDDPQELYNNRLYTMSGGPHDVRFDPLPAYPAKIRRETHADDGKPGYYALGTLALDGRLYQYLTTLPDFRAVKLIYSPDNGRSWHNQDGTTPIVWESKEQQSRASMVFLEEPQRAFTLLCVLQMGRNYEFNRDGYVYVYAPNGIAEGTMNELVMFRVPKARLLDRSAYEFFAGHRSRGDARWTRDIDRRAVVHTFPRGWVGPSLPQSHPYAWHPSIVYNAPLGVYLMANWGMGCSPDGLWFGKPSYLGFWIASNPWGPWMQMHEESAWTPGNDPGARAYQPQIAPKWIAPDGKSFWLVWTDFQHTSEFFPTLRKAFAADNHEDFIRLLKAARIHRPYYSFNAQRVDLKLV